MFYPQITSNYIKLHRITSNYIKLHQITIFTSIFPQWKLPCSASFFFRQLIIVAASHRRHVGAGSISAAVAAAVSMRCRNGVEDEAQRRGGVWSLKVPVGQRWISDEYPLVN